MLSETFGGLRPKSALALLAVPFESVQTARQWAQAPPQRLSWEIMIGHGVDLLFILEF